MEGKHTVEPPESKPNISPKLLPENYATCLWFLKFVFLYIFGFLRKCWYFKCELTLTLDIYINKWMLLLNDL
jgi:hypothetical protein